MPQRTTALILADVGAISQATPPDAIQALRDELVHFFAEFGDPRESAHWARAFAKAGAGAITRLLVAGWYHEYRSHAVRYSGAAGRASLAFLT